MENFLKLKHYEGARPGKRPAPTRTAGEVAEAKRAYEHKRVRSFNQKWLNEFKWLRYDDDLKHMYCDVCREMTPSATQDSSPFVKGLDNFKKDALKNHDTSKTHLGYMTRMNAESVPVSKSAAASCLLKLKQSEFDRLIIKFRTCHAIAKCHLSFNIFKTICRLDMAKGLDVGTSYQNDKSAKMFVSAIADVTQREVVTKIKNSKFCSFSIDGSTDFTGDDLDNIYVRTCERGRVDDTFLHIGPAESSTSRDIHMHVMSVFHSLGIDVFMRRKLVGFTADGASNMQGRKAGLATLLKEDWPHLVSTHCLAHRLELGFKDAIKKAAKVPYEKLMTLLMGIYYLYHKSPKQKKGLLRAFDVLETKSILPTRIGGTRWLPHVQRAIDAFLKGYRAITYQLQNSSHDNPKSEGLAKLATDGHVIVFLLNLKTVVGALMKLSLFLQKKDITLADAFTRVNATMDVMENMDTCNNDMASDVIESGVFMTVSVSFRGQKPKPVHEALITSVVDALHDRFPTDHCPVIEASTISGLNNWPSPDAENIKGYGVDEMKALHMHFKEVLNVELPDLLDDWSLLKALVYKKYRAEMDSGEIEWTDIYRALQGQVDHALDVISLLRSLPPTSVRNESTFSAMKLVKSKRRGKMGTRTLNDLLLIHLESPSVEEFDPEPAVKLWMASTPSGRRRHLGYERAQQQSTAEATAEATAEGPNMEDSEDDIQCPGKSDCDWSDGDDDPDCDNEMSEDIVDAFLSQFLRE